MIPATSVVSMKIVKDPSNQALKSYKKPLVILTRGFMRALLKVLKLDDVEQIKAPKEMDLKLKHQG